MSARRSYRTASLRNRWSHANVRSTILTGILLMFYYHPSVPQAYRDMKELMGLHEYGLFFRNMHRWAAHLMVWGALLHLLRVFYHRAYQPPRQFNWVIGVVLLLITLLLSYTGYLLPWDQLALWGISVGTNMAMAAPLIGKPLRFLLLGGSTVPFSRINHVDEPLWSGDRKCLATAILIMAGVLVIPSSAFRCWAIAVPTVMVAAAMFLAQAQIERPFHRLLRAVTLPEWIMTWFVLVTTILTLIGTFFRGPSWSLVWPWNLASLL